LPRSQARSARRQPVVYAYADGYVISRLDPGVEFSVGHDIEEIVRDGGLGAGTHPTRQQSRVEVRFRRPSNQIVQGLSEECAASCDNLLTVPKDKLERSPVGVLGPDKIIELARALRFALDINN
jgi:hypothetical protein